MNIDFSKYPLPKRLRHHTSPNFYMPVNAMKGIPAYYPPVHEKINWSKYFINGKIPDMLDIGCGKGSFLFQIALNNPDKNILGIELRLLPVQWIEGVIKGEGLENAGVMWYSVVNGMHFINDVTIDAAFYLFPDPWPKKKHNKRRAFNQNLLKELHRILKNDGKLYLASDLKEIHNYHIETLNSSGLFIFEEIINDSNWGLPVTNKEKFCRENNIEFYRLKCCKMVQ